MSATKQRPNFLTNQTVHSAVLTPFGSKTFVKKALPIAVSFIMHQRTNFDKDDFLTGTYNGVTYKMFKKTMHSSVFKEVHAWIQGALDALEKNYLREMYLLFCDQEDNDKIYESYKFQFKYMGEDVIPLGPPATKEEVTEATSNLLTAINSLDEHNLYNENEFAIKIALTYYDDITPADYEPPDFERNNAQDILPLVSKHSQHFLQLGLLRTANHVMKCRGKGDVFNLNHTLSTVNLLEDSAGDVEETNTEDRSAAKEIGGIMDDCFETELQADSMSVDKPAPIETEATIDKDLNAISSSSLTEISLSSENSDSPANNIQCICNIPVRFEHIDLVMCLQCSYLQHAACMGYLHSSDVADEYTCHRCKFGDDLLPEEKKRKQFTSIYRLAVADAYLSKKVPQDVLDELTVTQKRVILKKLKSFGIISRKDGQVDATHIKTTCLKGLFQLKEPASMTLGDSEEQEENSLVLESVPVKKRKYK